MSVANFTTIIELRITHGRDGTVWHIVNPDNTNQSYGYFERLSIEEGIMSVIPHGTLVLRDVGDLISDFNFTGKDKFYLKIKDSGENEIELSDYYVYQVARATDYQKKGETRFATIKFIHESYFFNERSVFDFEEDIKPICKQGSQDNWVAKIFQQYFPKDWSAGKAYGSNTKNYAWLKHKNLAFPNGRKTDQTKILNLLSYLAENANVDDDPPRADFFFWKDLTGVNFLSLGDEINASNQPEARYGVYDRNSIAPDGIVKIDDISVLNFSFMDLETSGAFQSYYERVDPNLDQPHFYLMDSTNSLKTKIINFNFLDYYPNFPFVDEAEQGSEGGIDWSPDTNIANFEIIDFGGQQIDISTLQGATSVKYTKRVYDEEKFGYFDLSYNNSDYYEPSYFYHTDGGITLTDFKSSRRTGMVWQTMFDIDEENPVDTQLDKNIAKLYIQLKKDKINAANIYFNLRNLKEKWNIFKYVICCLRQESMFEFWAMVYPIQIHSQKTGINLYGFREVYFIPKKNQFLSYDPLVDFVSGITLEQAGLTANNTLSGVPGSGFTFIQPIVNIGLGQVAFNSNEVRNFIGTVGALNFAYAGPGTNMDLTGYPNAFKNIAVGAALAVNAPSTAQQFSMGQVVKMTAIDWKTISGISIDETFYQNNRYLFMFDSQNDKEGFCDGGSITITS